MKKGLIWVMMLWCVAGVSQAKKNETLYSVAFYNLENLFDTIHDEGKNDYEYLPGGRNGWNTEKYTAKLANLAQVLGELATDKTPEGAAVIGMSEVENRQVLEDLRKQPKLAERGYEIFHYEGPDRRGIDCALFYRPDVFKVDSGKLVPYVYLNRDTVHATRGFLVVSGRFVGEPVHFIVCHWPSRGAGAESRNWAGAQVRAVKDELLQANPQCKIIVMGDMNDDPMDASMRLFLGAKREAKSTEAHDLYNPWWNTLAEEERGTLCYRGKWNLFDQIVITGNLLTGKRLSYRGNEVFVRDYLFQQEGRYKGYPKRTQAGGVWMNGYSDHLPTIIYLMKKGR